MSSMTKSQEYTHQLDIVNIILECTPLPNILVEEILLLVRCSECLHDNIDLYPYNDRMLCLLCCHNAACPVCGDISEVYGKVCNNCINDSKCSSWDER